MYPENKNPNRGRNIAIGVVVTLVFCGLLAGCIAVVMQYAKLYKEGKLQAWLDENSEEEDSLSEYGYYDDDGDFHYYGETEDEGEGSGFGYYDDDGEFHYYGEEDDYDDIFDHSTHEDKEGYETGEYFSLPADNRVDGLSYTVDMEDGEYYDEDSDYTYIEYSYAVVEGDVPNVDYINEMISSEWKSLLDFYEEDYKPGMYDDDYIVAQLECNVAYMSEDILSIVYHETLYYGEGGGNETDYYLYSLNFDMTNGQLLENAGILNIDEEFVEEFKERSEEQNDDSVLSYYTDSELMEYFEDEYSLILFYCPQGMEIGINVDEGWVTVTYPDYEEYLKRM